MAEDNINSTIFQVLENNIGKNIRVILDRNFGFEGQIISVSVNPPGVWLSKADAIVMRTTLANPIPKIVSREDRSEIFINLNFVQRIEIVH